MSHLIRNREIPWKTVSPTINPEYKRSLSRVISSLRPSMPYRIIQGIASENADVATTQTNPAIILDLYLLR